MLRLRSGASVAVGLGRAAGAGRSWLVAQFPAPLGVFGPAVGWALGRMGLAAAGVVRRVRARSWLVAQFPAPLRVFRPAVGRTVPRAPEGVALRVVA
ncbi:hypothetical protein GCM10010469_68410 [Streptomyces labedae]|uniref:Uncharacterized protein n=1 Tax=Streptomyces labedae TaxID=285569 RepID=A0ABP6R9C6_9ACTN